MQRLCIFFNRTNVRSAIANGLDHTGGMAMNDINPVFNTSRDTQKSGAGSAYSSSLLKMLAYNRKTFPRRLLIEFMPGWNAGIRSAVPVSRALGIVPCTPLTNTRWSDNCTGCLGCGQ